MMDCRARRDALSKLPHTRTDAEVQLLIDYYCVSLCHFNLVRRCSRLCTLRATPVSLQGKPMDDVATSGPATARLAGGQAGAAVRIRCNLLLLCFGACPATVLLAA